MKTVVAALLFLFLGSAQGAQDFTGVRRLELRISAGNVRVSGADGDAASLSVQKKRYDERCRLAIEQSGDRLVIELGPRSLFSALCEADFEIRVPKAAVLRLKSGAGNVSVADTTGPVTAELGSGDLEVKGRVPSFEASVGAGTVRAEGLEAAATVRTGNGNIRLVYGKAPTKGQLRLRSGHGDAEVFFPREARIRTSFLAGAGHSRNRLGDTPGAPFTVSMKTGSGDLIVGNL